MRIFVFTFLFLTFFKAFPQSELFLGLHVEVGTFNPKFGYHGDMLTKSKMPFESSKRLVFAYRFNDMWTFDFAHGGKAYTVNLFDNSVTSQYSPTGIGIRTKAKIGTYQFGVARSGSLGKNFYLQLKISYIRDRVKEEVVTEKAYVGNYNVQFASSYKKNNAQLTPQLGLEYRFSEGQILRWAINYNIPVGKGLVNYTYQRTNVVSNGTTIEFGKHKGQYWGFVVGLDFPLNKGSYDGQQRPAKLPVIRQKQEKEPKPEKVKEPKVEKIKEPKTPKIKEPKEKKHADTISRDKEKTIKQFKERKVQPMGTYLPQSDTLYISVYDNYKEDGDIVSIFLNGEVILHEHTLTKKEYKFKVVIPPGKSELVLFAHNLGKRPPNTMGVTISDGKTQHKIVLNSDYKTSGALHIDYRK